MSPTPSGSSRRGSRRATAAALAAASVAALTLAGCSGDSNTSAIIGTPPIDPLFASYVALGNSITAGYQSDGINDSTQRQSYPRLLAIAMGTRYAYPALRPPGCPPPIVNFQTQARLGGGTATSCSFRSPASVTAALNNVAVPGALAIDPTSVSSASSSALTTFILGGRTQVQRAAAAQPTFFSAWVGNNDALAAAVQGVIDSAAAKAYGLPGRLTPLRSFQTSYDAMVAGLKGLGTVKGGVLVGVVQVTSAPILFPAQALLDPQFKAGFDQFVGQTTTVLPNCTGSTSLISFRIVSAIRAGQHPATIGCAKNSVPGTPVGDIFVLDAAEQASLASAITAYNTYIQGVASANGWAYWDPNPALQQLKASGCISTVPDLASTTAPFGSCISLDGVHPSLAGHTAIAQGVGQAINAQYKTTLFTVALAAR